jgi:hypothetical protein
MTEGSPADRFAAMCWDLFLDHAGMDGPDLQNILIKSGMAFERTATPQDISENIDLDDGDVVTELTDAGKAAVARGGTATATLSRLAEIGPKTVRVLGYKWSANAPWAGLHFDKAVLRTGSIWSDDDYHLDVPWLHPDDVAMEPYPDAWCRYRVRPARGWHSFVLVDGVWMVSKDRPA